MSRLQIQTGFMRALAVLALALLVTACGGNSGGTGQKPNISSFTATPPTVRRRSGEHPCLDCNRGRSNHAHY